MMCLIEERERQFVEVAAQLMKGLVGDHGDSVGVREVCFYFRWRFGMLCRDDERVGRIARNELLDEIERRKNQQTMTATLMD
jgi:hypothetical protein